MTNLNKRLWNRSGNFHFRRLSTFKCRVFQPQIMRSQILQNTERNIELNIADRIRKDLRKMYENN